MPGETRAPTKEMSQAIRQLARQREPVAELGLDLAAEAINSEAQIDAPVLSGFLKESHLVTKPRRGVRELGATADYAAAVHETHPIKAKWYQNTILQKGPTIIRRSLTAALARLNGGS